LADLPYHVKHEERPTLTQS